MPLKQNKETPLVRIQFPTRGVSFVLEGRLFCDRGTKIGRCLWGTSRKLVVIIS